MKSTLALFITIVSLLLFNACQKQCKEKCMSKCMNCKVDDFKKTNCEKGVCVKEYLFQSKTVFVFDPGKCGADMTSEVIDEDCNSIGFLGGISGNTVINGEDFSEASFVRTVWEK